VTKRFIRDYKLVVRASGGDVTIVPPMRISFSVIKSIAGALNRLTVKIYNLKESNRLALVKDAEDVKYIPISLYIGYKGKYELAYKGSVHKGNNARSGVDVTTTLECLDGGFAYLNYFTSTTLREGVSPVGKLLLDMYTITKGKITTQQSLTRPRVLVGNTVKLLNDVVAEYEDWYIEDEQLYIIKKDEVTSHYIPVIKASTGLINTPSREAKRISFKILIDPTVKVGRLVKLESSVQPHLNGIYKIETITYSGDNYGSDWSQTCSGFLNSDYKVI